MWPHLHFDIFGSLEKIDLGRVLVSRICGPKFLKVNFDLPKTRLKQQTSSGTWMSRVYVEVQDT